MPAAQHPLLGLSGGLNPWDNIVTLDLLRNMVPQPTFACFTLGFRRWHKIKEWPEQAQVYGQEFYDATYELNKHLRLIAVMTDVPREELKTWVPMILAKYPKIEAVVCTNEDPVYERCAESIVKFAESLPDVNLGGPGIWRTHHPAYFDVLIKMGALQKLKWLCMHDYSTCPGLGDNLAMDLWEVRPHYQPDDGYDGMPNLPERLRILKSYLPLLRTDRSTGWPVLMLTEVGVYQRDAPAATRLAQICRESEVPFILQNPEGPAATPGGWTYANTLYTRDDGGNLQAQFTTALLEFLNAMGTPAGEIQTNAQAIVKLNKMTQQISAIEALIKTHLKP
jgi:hypothetical protein